MIPPIVGPSTTSAGEREIFLRLRDDQAAAAWTVLHSLGLARHEEGVAGEADFVIIIPSRGVLCIEVKGCSSSALRRDRGLWFFAAGDRGDPRGPFKQASEAMHSLRREILRTRPDLSGTLFASCVIFPYARFTEQSPEWQPWEVIDTVALRSAPIHQLLNKVLDSTREYIRSVPRAPRLVEGSPTLAQCDALRETLRGNFEIPTQPSTRSAVLKDELRRFTTEQYAALDAMSENRRALFLGPAGTGKTFLALEAVRRSHLAGHRVLFLCFNRLLGNWLIEETASFQPGVTTRTLHQHLRQVCEPMEVPAERSTKFWTTDLPLFASERITEGQGDGRWIYDELIVDEAQDLAHEPYLSFLDLSVRGGLGSGRWRFFGDFENQAIYGSTGLTFSHLRNQLGEPPVFRLRVNCRNTPLIAEYAQLLPDLRPRYDRILRPDDGIQPVLRFFSSSQDQCQLLTQTLSEFEKSGFLPHEITVLSPRAEGACSTRVSAPSWKGRLRPFRQGASRDGIAYASIQAFKGLESPAVVVTDIDTISTAEARALFYIATTRPLQRLTIIARDRVRDEAVGILRGDALGQEGAQS